MSIKKIMAYSPSIYGHGASTWLIALMTGLRNYLDNPDFLVVTGAFDTQRFIREKIDVVRLPSLYRDESEPDFAFYPTFLKSLSIETAIGLRENIITSTFDVFKPDLLLVQHNTVGFAGEIMPILLKKWRAIINHINSFKTIFVSRGIIANPCLVDAKFDYRYQQSQTIDVGALYDRVYILDSQKYVDANWYFPDMVFQNKIKYLGKICTRSNNEIIPSLKIRSDYGIPSNAQLILVTMGREHSSRQIIKNIIQAFDKFNACDRQILWVQLDLSLDLDEAFIDSAASNRVRFHRDFPELIHFINSADLVISRGGYSTVAEILQTNTKAIIIPNERKNQEQLFRSQILQDEENTIVMRECECDDIDTLHDNMNNLLKQEAVDRHYSFSKERIAKIILADIQGNI